MYKTKTFIVKHRFKFKYKYVEYKIYGLKWCVDDGHHQFFIIPKYAKKDMTYDPNAY